MQETKTKYFVFLKGEAQEIKSVPLDWITSRYDQIRREPIFKNFIREAIKQGVMESMHISDYYRHSVDRYLINIDTISVITVPVELRWEDYISHRNDYPVQEYNIKDLAETYFLPEYSKTTDGNIYDTRFSTSGLIQVQYFSVELCSEVIVDADVEFSPILLHILSHYYTTSPFENSVAVTYRTNEAKLIYENKKAITKTEYYLKGTVDLDDCPSATNRPIPIPIK